MGNISRFVTFNHDTSRRITVYVKFWQGAHGHTRSTYNFIIIIIYIIFKEGYTLTLKPAYQVALFNNIYNIDSNIYNIIQIKAMVTLGCINTCTSCIELRFDLKLILS